MKWNNRLSNYNFWISLVSAVLLILQAFDLHFDVAYANEIITAVLGLLVVIGIINDPTKTYNKSTHKAEKPAETLPAKPENMQQTEGNEDGNSTFSNADCNNLVQPEEKVAETNSLAETEQVCRQELNSTPIASEVENCFSINENDFKTIINKISADLNYCLNQLSASKINEQTKPTEQQKTGDNKENLQVEEMPKQEEKPSENTSEKPEQSTCYSIVN